MHPLKFPGIEECCGECPKNDGRALRMKMHFRRATALPFCAKALFHTCYTGNSIIAGILKQTPVLLFSVSPNK